MTIEPTFTINEVSKALKLSTRTIQRWIDAGKLRAINLSPEGEKSAWRIPASELRRLGVEVR